MVAVTDRVLQGEDVGCHQWGLERLQVLIPFRRIKAVMRYHPQAKSFR